MSCTDPIYAYKHELTNRRKEQGLKAKVTLNAAMKTHNLLLPCGKCLGCKTKRAQEWALRSTHEASLYNHNAFITLTMNNEAVHPAGFLEIEELQNFIKRLRERIRRGSKLLQVETDKGSMRYLACGEYGSKTLRPHYHALLFNIRFTDARRVGRELKESDILNELWPHGQCKIGEVTEASANYVAQYTISKMSTPTWKDDEGTTRPEPFLIMSTVPPIGTGWVNKYRADLQRGYIQHGDTTAGIPRAYGNHIAKSDAQEAEWLKYKAYIHATRHRTEDTRLPEEVRKIKAQIQQSRKEFFDHHTI